MAATSIFSQADLDKKRRNWTPSLDTILVSCMVELYHLGSHTHEISGFKTGYLTELERMITKKLPNAGIKAKPHIESRIKTLKKEWGVLYDMIYGKHISGFGWDANLKVVTAEAPVWDAYLVSHPAAIPCRTRTFPRCDKFCMIYSKDRATGKNAQDANTILKNMERDGGQEKEDNAEKGDVLAVNELQGENSVALDDLDLSAAQDEQEIASKKDEVTSSSKKRKRGVDAPTAKCILDAATLLGNNIKEVGIELSKSIGFDVMIQEKSLELNNVLSQIEGLTEDKRDIALSKIPNYPRQMFVFLQLVTWPKTCIGEEILDGSLSYYL